tara:strand:+ start:238 stop:735 length:498 start_codon:yes stop_codon:yes gene_type:complete
MADTYSFDIVSDFDKQELVNAVDQLTREVNQRYDLKDSNTLIQLEESLITINTSTEMTLQSVQDLLRNKATKRKISLKIFDFQPHEASGGNRIKQNVLLKKGLSQDLAKKISKSIRDEFKKINVSIQGEAIRVSSKNKDHLQLVITFVRDMEDEFDVPLQFENYR